MPCSPGGGESLVERPTVAGEPREQRGSAAERNDRRLVPGVEAQEVEELASGVYPELELGPRGVAGLQHARRGVDGQGDSSALLTKGHRRVRRSA